MDDVKYRLQAKKLGAWMSKNEILEKGEQDIIGFLKLRSIGREAVDG